MNSRRWLATILVLIVAVGILSWSISQLRHDEQERTTAEQTLIPTALSAPPNQPGADIAPPAEAAASAAPAIGTLPAKGGATVGTVAELPPPAIDSAFKPLPKGEFADVEGQLDQINLMLRDYRTIGGTNPVGTNAEIMKAVMGENPKKATLGPPEGQSLNSKGELMDPWGTPYFFHQLSGVEMEIRSAGPDGEMWNQDDQVLTSATGAIRAPAPR